MKLALGSAQFGLDYGIANSSGLVPFDEIVRILHRAAAAGMDTLDTAIGYGNSEQRLGQAGVRGWKVITKLPGLPDPCAGVAEWVAASVEGSLARLGVERVHGLLLHRPADLMGRHGSELHDAMLRLVNDGRVGKIGVSIYAPAELDLILSRFEIGLVQAPYNVFDRRMETSGWFNRLGRDGIEIHTRSTFLQGLLLQDRLARAERFRRWDGLWQAWESWLAGANLTPAQAALGFAYRNPAIDRVLVGVDSERHLRDLLEIVGRPAPEMPEAIATQDEDLLDPSNWNAL